MKMSIGLSFNGVATVYRGEAAEFGVKVAPSGIGSARAERLAGELSRRLGREVVVGDAELTVYVGKSAEIPFLGLAEGNGQGSAAFVNLDATASDELLLEVAAHEAGHLLGTVRHAGEGLAACAYEENGSATETTGVRNDLLIANSTSVPTADYRYMFVSANGSVTNLTVSTGGGVYLRGKTAGTSAFWSGGTIKAGGLTVSNRGVANEIDLTGGGLVISDGGVAANAEAIGGGSMRVFSGAVLSGAALTGSKTRFYVSGGGIANEITISDQGLAYIYTGGTATNVRENGGMVYAQGKVTFVANEFSDLQLTGSATVHSGTTATRTSIYEGGSMQIFAGGSANGTVMEGGSVNMKDGYLGIAAMTGGAVTASKGEIAVAADGTARDIAIVGGATTMTVSNGAVVSGIDVSGASKEICIYISGAEVDGLTMNIGSADTYADATLKNIDLSGSARVHVTSTTLINASSYDGAYLWMMARGSARNVTVGSKGYFSLWTATATADGVTVLSGGTLGVNTVASGFNFNVASGAIFLDTTTDNMVWCGENTTIAAGAVDAYGAEFSAANGVFTNVDLNADSTTSSMLRVGDGVTIENGKVAFSGGLRVYSGAEVKGLVVNDAAVAGRDIVEIYDGAVVSGLSAIAPSKGPGVNVYSGGVLTGFVNSGGYLRAQSTGALISGGTNVKGDNWAIAGGAVADVDGRGGTLWAADGGLLSNIRLSAGNLNLRDGIASNVTVYGGTLNTLREADMTTSTFISGGWRNGKAFDTVVSGGTLAVRFGSAVRASMFAGSAQVSSGGSMLDALVSGGTVDMFDGGYGSKMTLSGANAALKISGGAVLEDLYIKTGLVYLYGDAESTGLLSGAKASGGTIHVSSGGRADDVAITTGYLRISEGGFASGAEFTGFDARAYFSAATVEGNTAGCGNEVTVNSLGRVFVYSGAQVTNITENGGYVYVANNATASFIANAFSDLDIAGNLNAAATLHSGTTATRTRIYSGGSFYVYAGGSADGVTTFSGGTTWVSSAGFIANGAVLSGGTMMISANAVAENVSAVGGEAGSSAIMYVRGATVSGLSAVMNTGAAATWNAAEALIYVSNGAFAEDVYVSGGRVNVTNNGEISGVKIADNGGVCIFSGGRGYDFDITGVTYSGILRVSQGYASGIAVSGTNNYALVHSEGGLIEDVRAVNAKIYASNGGTVRNAVMSGGSMYVYGTVSGARLENANATIYADGLFSGVTMLAGGTIHVRGTLSDAVVNSGTVLVSGATVDGIKLSAAAEAGAMLRVSGGTVSNALLAGGSMIAISGGAISGITVLNNTLRASSGGTVSNATIVGSGAMFRVVSEGVAENVRTMSDGYITLSKGGVANNVTADEGGLVYVSEGGVLTGLQVDGGRLIMRGGVCSNAVMTAGELDTIESRIDGELKQPDGVISGVTMTGGRLFVFSGAALNVSATGGTIDVTSGGTATFADIGGDTTLNIDYSDGTSAARIDTLATVGTTVDVNVTGIKAAGTYALAATGNTDLWVDVIDGVYEQILANGGSYTNAATGLTYGFDGTNVTATTFSLAAKATAAALSTDDAALNTDDRAAKWDATTEYTGSVTFANDSISGDAWLVIDGTNVASALYGAAGTFAHTVNIAAKSGTIRNLAAGAAAGGSVAAVNLTLDGADLTGVAYAGGFGSVTGDTDTLITAGEFSKDFYAGALANKLATATSVGDVELTVAGGSFAGNIYGASAVKTADASGVRHTAGDVTLTVTGGATTKGTQACIFAGGYATGTATGTVYTVDSVTATISGGSWGAAAGGRGVFGGVMASGVDAEVTGDVNLTISGGEMGNVYGGGWAQKGGSSTVGNVFITISGGTVANVFGGGSHSTDGAKGATSVGNVSITISGGTVANAIFAKGQGVNDSVLGTATVTISGDYLESGFAADIFGYGYVGGTGVSDALNFADCRGAFTGDIGGFAGINFSGDTRVSFDADSISNTAWNFDVTERGGWFADDALLTWSEADFTEGTVKLTVDADQTNAWSVISGADAAAYSTAAGAFVVEIDGGASYSLTFDAETGKTGAIAAGEFAGWGFALEDSVLKFKNLA